MEEPPPKEAMGGGETSLNSIGEDILQDILSRLPALTFASAACVSRSWNLLSKRILTRPKLLSSLSLIPNLQIAVNEVLDKVLAEPIQPHFAIAYVGKKFSLLETHYLIMSKLGSRIPIIVSEAYGIIGSDSLTDEHKEVKWVDYDNENGMEDYNTLENRNHGIVLILGFVPGLKVCAIPLIQSIEGVSQMSAIDKFVTDIKYYTASVSGCTSPVGIIMFSDIEADMKPVLEKMDYAMSGDTVIIGDESGCFLCNNGVDSFIFSGSRQYSWFKNMKEQKYQRFKGDAIALVFAMDGGKVQGIGEIQLSLALSTGVSPIGPIYKGGSVRVAKDTECKCSTWLTARREGSLEKLDGETMLNDIEDELSLGKHLA